MAQKTRTNGEFMVEYKKTSFKYICKSIDLEFMTFLTTSYIVTFKDDVVRYFYNMASSDFEEFKKFEEKLFQQFLQIIQPRKNKIIYIVSYQSGWEKADGYSKEKIDVKNGVLLTDEICVIEEIFKNAMRYKAFPVFVDTSQKIAIIPTDHLDFFVVTDMSVDNFVFDKDTFSIKVTRQSGDGSMIEPQNP